MREERVNDDQNVNLKGTYLMTHYFIATQPNPKEPAGSIITVSSGRAGFMSAGGSSYNITKLADQRLMEHVQIGKHSLSSSHSLPPVPPPNSHTS
jgi:NAD(P)-dependent dehydrogenase (short-subunit alcohol dehydrogenase family)